MSDRYPVLIVRPDQHVAWRGESDEAAGDVLDVAAAIPRRTDDR